jgi:hypothetical protein
VTTDSQLIAKPVVWLILSMVSAISVSCYVAKVWSANQSPHFSDLYAPWWAAHELFLRGRSPYRPEVAHEIQAVIYGAPRMAGYPGDDSALAGGFAYPLYAASLLWPTVRMSFPAVEKMFFCVSVLAVLGSLACWLRALRFHPPPVQWLTIAFLVFGSFPVLQGLKLENLSLIAAALLAVTMVLLSTDHLILAGLFMAASTFKPQFTIVLIPWLVCWISSDWRRRRALAWSFLATMLLLIGGSELLMPGWIGDFLRIVRAYKHYTFARSLLDLWLGTRVAPFAAAGLLVAVFVLCWRNRRRPANSADFFLTTSLTLAATLTVIPTLAPHCQVLLLPGFLSIIRYRTYIWASSRFSRLLLVSVWLLLAWPSIAAAGLTLATIWLPVNSWLRWWEMPLYTSPVLPFAVFVVLGWLVSRRIAWADQDIEPSP